MSDTVTIPTDLNSLNDTMEHFERLWSKLGLDSEIDRLSLISLSEIVISVRDGQHRSPHERLAAASLGDLAEATPVQLAIVTPMATRIFQWLRPEDRTAAKLMVLIASLHRSEQLRKEEPCWQRLPRHDGVFRFCSLRYELIDGQELPFVDWRVYRKPPKWPGIIDAVVRSGPRSGEDHGVLCLEDSLWHLHRGLTMLPLSCLPGETGRQWRWSPRIAL